MLLATKSRRDDSAHAEIDRASLGWVQCRTKKYDTWFSGGLDLRFRRIKAVGKDGEAVLDKPSLIEVNPSRDDCEDNDWKVAAC